MQLSSRDGIACDLCGMSFRHDFIYYSFEFKKVNVYGNRRPSLDDIISSETSSESDVCTQCYEKFSQTVVQVYGKLMGPVSRKRVETVCEYSGVVMAGTYSYYYAVVTKVIVKMTGQPNVCIACKNQFASNITICPKCKSNRFSCVASVRSINRFLEISISDSTYQELMSKLAVVKKSQGQWSTQS